MWELRLILVLIGAVIITGVYLLSRQSRKRGEEGSGKLRRKSPVFNNPTQGGDEFDDIPAPDESAPHVAADTRSGNPDASGQQLILALHVAAREGASFDGTKVLETFNATGLKYGHYRIFHRLLKGDPDKSVFSVANMVEPGALDPEALAGQSLPGLTLFLVLPGYQDGVDAYADMLTTARHLAQQLGGEVLDETRSTLTRQTAHHIRERIIEFQRHLQLRQRS
ncbi:MAG: cell division protein ZipA [Gammaproteobacteria bacterium]